MSHVLAALRDLKLAGAQRLWLVEGVNAKRYFRNAVVTAHQSKDPVTVVKPWGRQSAGPGCWVVKETAETFDVKVFEKAAFEVRFEACEVPKHSFRSKTFVLATQMPESFNILLSADTDVNPADSTKLVDGKGLATPASPRGSTTPSSPRSRDNPAIVASGHAGDYLVQNAEGDQWVVAGAVFKDRFIEASVYNAGDKWKTKTRHSLTGGAGLGVAGPPLRDVVEVPEDDIAVSTSTAIPARSSHVVVEVKPGH
jgi:hypothetical protein